MKNKTYFKRICIQSALCVCAAFYAMSWSWPPSGQDPQHPVDGPNALTKFYPGWDVQSLLPATTAHTLANNSANIPGGFTGHIGGMAFLSDGRLAVADFPDPSIQPWKGQVWLLTGAQTGSSSQVTAKSWGPALYAPTGLVVVAGDIYVIDANNLKKIHDSAGAAVATTITGSWSQSGGQPAVSGLAYQNNFFYSSVSSSGLSVNGVSISGGTMKISMTGSVQLLTTGYRNTGGAAINSQGDIFATDNQGEWLPSNKLINVVQGRYYGYGGTTSNGKAASPPAVWFPEGMDDHYTGTGTPTCATTEDAFVNGYYCISNYPTGDASTWAAGNSPDDILPIDTGLFAGQYFVGDLRYGEIDRVFLEKVAGEYQGAFVHFSAGFNSSPYRMTMGPDGALYIGALGGSGYTWSWHDNDITDDWGLWRANPNGKSVFQILAVRAKAGGFELQFTSPLGNNAGAAGNFKVQSWIYQSNSTYGGPQVNEATLPVQATQMSTDKTRLFLAIPGLYAGSVVHIQLDSNAVVSSLGEKPWTFETWYTLNNLSTDSPVPLNSETPKTGAGFFQAKATTGGGIRIESETPGAYRIRDAQGKILEQGFVDGAQARESKIRFQAGLYFVSMPGMQSVKVLML